jgi:hypothetical protein
LIARSSDKFLELGSLLRRLQESEPANFQRLIAIPQLGKRKAYYLVEIARAFGEVSNQERFRLAKIGWTKLQVIAAHVRPENKEELLSLAEENTVENLKALMRGDQPIVDGRSVLLHFTGNQFGAFSSAILKHGAIKSGAGFIDKEAALISALCGRNEDALELVASPELQREGEAIGIIEPGDA